MTIYAYSPKLFSFGQKAKIYMFFSFSGNPELPGKPRRSKMQCLARILIHMFLSNRKIFCLPEVFKHCNIRTLERGEGVGFPRASARKYPYILFWNLTQGCHICILDAKFRIFDTILAGLAFKKLFGI